MCVCVCQTFFCTQVQRFLTHRSGGDEHFLYKGWNKHFNIFIQEGGNKYFSTQWWGDKHFLYIEGDKCFYPRMGVRIRRG